MAIKELYPSRVTEEFTQGTNMQRVFQMTHTEYNNDWDIFNGNALGDSVLDGDFPLNTRNLRVIKIRQQAIDNINTSVAVSYSSQNTPNTEAIPDAANSWIESTDISPIDNVVTTFFNQATGEYDDWDAYWTANKAEGAASDAPNLIIRDSAVVFNVTMYGTTYYFNRILNAIHRINGVKFLENYFAFAPQNDIPNDVNIDDRDQWLFTACPIERVAKNTWRYDFQFEFNTNSDFGWNNVGGIDVPRYSNLAPGTNNQFNFIDLFEGMDFVIDTDVSLDTGR